MTKVRVPSCGTCGNEEVVEVEKDHLIEKIEHLRKEEEALIKLLDRGPASEPDDSYRKKTIRRLIAKARSQREESERILALID